MYQSSSSQRLSLVVEDKGGSRATRCQQGRSPCLQIDAYAARCARARRAR